MRQPACARRRRGGVTRSRAHEAEPAVADEELRVLLGEAVEALARRSPLTLLVLEVGEAPERGVAVVQQRVERPSTRS